MRLSEISIHSWLEENHIKNEGGNILDFKDHLFLFDIYADNSPKLVCYKAAQIGFTTMALLKSIWLAKMNKMDIIYTMPSATDVREIIGGKINRLISNNPILLEYVKDKDAIEQKQFGNNIIYYRGTFTEKSALGVSSDLNIHDEEDRSKQDVIQQYSSRLQHSSRKWEWHFSNPSAEGNGVSKYWAISDQKHWFIKCNGCLKEQFLSWPESIDLTKRIFICKHCQKELTKDERRKGKWIPQQKDKEYSGYWISLLMAPWITANEIIKYYETKSPEYFYNFVLGLPYAGDGSKLSREALMNNLNKEIITPAKDERVIMGVDTGLKLDYVMGTEKGLFYHGDCKDYSELDKHMITYPRLIAIVDGGGDLIGSRKFKERWPGRVFLGFLGGDKKGTDECKWNDKEKTVAIDRSKYIQMCVDEFIDKKIPLQGVENDWYDYWLDWNNLMRIKVFDDETGMFKGFKWIRSGRDHRALATVFWRVGMTRFSSQGGKIFTGGANFKSSDSILEDDTMHFKPKFIYEEQEQALDWRL